MLASLALLTVCRASIARSVDAREAERDLQRRWGSLSIGRALLPRAEDVLSTAEMSAGESLVSVRTSLTLNGMPVKMVFGDESAKANLNVLLERGRRDAMAAVRELLGGTGVASKVELRPERLLDERVGSIAELFTDALPEQLADGARPAAARVTAWGDGRLNVYRAPPDVLKAVLSPTLNLGHLTKLAKVRATTPKPNLSAILNELELTTAQRGFAEARLTSTSAVHSLWLITSGPRRNTYDLIVYNGAVPAQSRTNAFEW